MQQTECTDDRDRQVICTAWHNTDGQRHRTTGPAVENWTVFPGGGHVLSFQGWYLNGEYHREGRPAYRRWHIADGGTRVLEYEEWYRHGKGHRVGAPSYRGGSMELHGTRKLVRESWRVNGKLHRVDGPAYEGRSFYWHGVEVRQDDLPWLRCGQGILAGLAGGRGAGPQGEGAAASSPAWCRDARVAMIRSGSVSNTPATYLSAEGGAVLLCM